MNEQLSLFAPDEIERKDEKAQRIDAARDAAPEDVALVYTCTECGNSTGGHYFMRIDDAKRFCADPRSCGTMHGTRWAFFWTSLKNYVGNYWDLTLHGVDFTKFCDNGSRDALCAEIGVRPLSAWQVFDDLERAGIRLKRPLLSMLNPHDLDTYKPRRG